MRDFKTRRLPRRAVTIVLVLAAADGAGIYFAQQKLAQPWDAPRSAFAEPQVAEAAAPRVVPDNKPLPAAVVRYDFPSSAPSLATANYEPLPIPEYKPTEIDLTQYEKARDQVARRPVVPSVKIAALRRARFQPDLYQPNPFYAASKSDISRSIPASEELPQVGFTASDDTASEVPSSAVPALPDAQIQAEASEALALELPVTPSAPVAAETATPALSASEQEPAAQPVPMPPAADAGSQAELPAL